MLREISRNKLTLRTVVKRSDSLTGEVIEYQIHDTQDDLNPVRARYTTKWEADTAIDVNPKVKPANRK